MSNYNPQSRDHNPRPQVKVVNAMVNIVNGQYIRRTTYNHPNILSHCQNVEGVTFPDNVPQYVHTGAAGHYYPHYPNGAINMAIQGAAPDTRIYTNSQSNATTQSTEVIAQSNVLPMSDATAHGFDRLFQEAFKDSAWVQTPGPPPVVHHGASQERYMPSPDFGMHQMLGMVNQMSTNFTPPGATTTQTIHGISSSYNAPTHSVYVPGSRNR